MAVHKEADMSTGKPEVDFPGGYPPSELQITEIWGGSGKAANPGDMVRVHYVAVAYSTGEEATRAGTGASPWSSSSAPGVSSQAGTRVSRA